MKVILNLRLIHNIFLDSAGMSHDHALDAAVRLASGSPRGAHVHQWSLCES